MQEKRNPPHQKVAIWLFACCLMIALMVLIGGLTRLTHSGLSMTRWHPVSGIIPPHTEAAWQQEFAHYKQSPEYKQHNFGMSLQDFKGIFWLEFIHRLLGRLTGFVFFVPFIIFLVKKQIDPPLIKKLAGIFLLGAAQGVVGWLMVSSGLKDNPYVSPVWLSFHLCTAFLIYAFIFLLGLSEWKRGRELSPSPNPVGLKRFSLLTLLMVYMQVLLGGLVAGNKAGLVYNTFPDMNGQYIPDGLWVVQPWYANFIQNVTTIQFDHRMGAYMVALLTVILAVLLLRKPYKALHKAAMVLIAVVALQITLGIKTLLFSVPVGLASAHQVMALVLFSTVLFIVHGLYRPASKRG